MATDSIEKAKHVRKVMVNITEEQREWLRKEAYTRQTTMSKIVRTALSNMIDGERAKIG